MHLFVFMLFAKHTQIHREDRTAIHSLADRFDLLQSTDVGLRATRST